MYKEVINLIKSSKLQQNSLQIGLYFAGMFLVQSTSAILFPRLFPKTFAQLSQKNKTDWHIKFVSHVHALFVLLALGYFLCCGGRNFALDRDTRLDAYSQYLGSTFAVCTGYFLWDLVICLWYLRWSGWGFLGHAFFSCLILLLSYAPAYQYYLARAFMIEASTPFVNIHWFLTKMNFTNSNLLLINDILLLVTFFIFRVVYAPLVAAEFVNLSLTHGKVAINTIIIPATVFMNVLNIFWFYKLVVIAINKIRVNKEKRRLNRESNENLELLSQESIMQKSLQNNRKQKSK